MAEQSRTRKSIKNIGVAFAFMGVNLLLQFFVRKVFLDHLGTEILGLNTTATNLLQFLNLAELGIGAAVGFALYKPLLDDDRQTISEIVSLQGHLCRRIALWVIGGAVLISAFFPWIFAKADLPLWNAYASFGVLFIPAISSYYFNYKQIILSADQKEYKILYSYRSCMILRLLVQFFAVKYLPHPYLWWLATEGLFAIGATWMLHRMVKRTYPYLQTRLSTWKELRGKYPTIVTRIKQAFIHRISTYVLQQTSPLVIYGFATLTLVTLYGNYVMIMTGAAVFVNALLNSQIGSIGNLIAEGNKERTMSVFEELFSVRFLIASVVSIGIFVLTPPFIKLWIGEEYLLSEMVLLILAVTFFVNVSCNCVENFIAGYGMYQDVWAAIAEAGLNLGLSVLFGFFWGLEGILLGVLASRIAVIFIWKPIFLYWKGFRYPLWHYIRLWLINFLALGVVLAALYLMREWGYSLEPATWMDMGLYALIFLTALSCLTLFSSWLLVPSMRRFTERMLSLVGRLVSSRR